MDVSVKDAATTEAFTTFVETHEPRLRNALTAALGPDQGREATADALAYAWEHWDRIRAMENPGAYLFVLGRNRGRRLLRRRSIVLPMPEAASEPWVEPGLPHAMARLTEHQRAVVMLVDGYDWSLSEAAGMLGMSKSAAQKHRDRGLAKLRRRLGVTR